MEQIDKIKAFVTRRRRLSLVLLGGSLILVAVLFKKYELSWGGLAQAGLKLTHSMQAALERQQPGQVLGEYFGFLYGHCSYDPNCGPKNIFTIAWGILTATPRVFGAVWRTGDGFSRLILLVTIAAMLLMVFGSLTDRASGMLARAIGAVFSVIWAPAVIALVFWVLLHLLILMTWIVGAVLSGVVVVITTCGGFWEVGKHLVEALKKSDHLEDESLPFLRKLFGFKGAAAAAGTTAAAATATTAAPAAAATATASVIPPAGGV